MLAVKIGAVALHLALCLGLYLLIIECTSVKWLGLCAILIVSASRLHLYLLTEFISNLGGITTLVWSGWCWLRFQRTKKREWLLTSIVLLVLAGFSHKSIFAIAALLLVFSYLQRSLLGSQSKMRRRLFFLVIGFCWIAPAVVALQQMVRIPDDWIIQFTSIPKLPFDAYAFPEEIVLLILSLTIISVLVTNHVDTRSSTSASVLITIAVFALVVTLNPFLNSDLGWTGLAERIRALSYVQLAILIPLGISILATRRKNKFLPAIIAFIVPMLLVSATLPLPPGLQPSYLERRSHLIESLRPLRATLSASTLIIAAHGDEFVTTATTGLPSQQKPAAANTDYERVLWLVSEVPESWPAVSQSTLLFKDADRDTILIDELILKGYLQDLGAFERNELFRRNPHVVRVFAKR